jgi:DNA-binding transcriptional LysR family regulator
MTLDQLRVFVAVAERQHVTRAADALHLTQSAVSGALAALEARHAVRLFDRVGRGVALSVEGAAFLREARAVLAAAAAAEAALTDLSGLRRGTLSLRASQTVVACWLPFRLVRFHAAYPGIALDVGMGNSAEVARAVAEGATELGIVEGAVQAPDLERTVVGGDRLVLVAAPGHAWSGGRAPDAASLQAARWVMREHGSGTRTTLEEALAAIGVDPARLDVAMTLPGNEAVLAAVQAGAGVAALAESVAADALAATRLIAVPFDLPRRDYVLLRHRERYRSRASTAFVALLTG